jgi:hypothetical protein
MADKYKDKWKTTSNCKRKKIRNNFRGLVNLRNRHVEMHAQNFSLEGLTLRLMLDFKNYFMKIM